MRIIEERVGLLRKAQEQLDTELAAATHREIVADALNVMVSGGWHSPGDLGEDDEYLVTLAGSVPRVELHGELFAGSPISAELLYDERRAPEKALTTTPQQDELLLEYAREFYFGA